MIDEKRILEQTEQLKQSQFADERFVAGVAAVEVLIEFAPKVGEWIPCGKEKPRGGENIATVKWYDGTIEVVHAYYDGFDWITGCGKRAEVIAWMPLPPAFEGE